MSDKTYDITAPDGRTFRITGPADSTPEQALAEFQKSFSAAAAPDNTIPYTSPPTTWRGKGEAAMDAVQGTPYVGPMVKGAVDPAVGAAQLFAHTANAVSPSLFSNQSVKNVDQNIAAGEQRYEQSRVRNNDGKAGFDWGRLIGNAAATAPMMKNAIQTGQHPTGYGMLVNGARNFGSGAGLGLLTPVTDPNKDYWDEKFNQAVTGGTVGVMAPPFVNSVVGLASNGINKLVQTGVNKVAQFTGDLRSQATNYLTTQLAQSGIDFNKLTTAVKGQLLGEVEDAIKVGGTLSAEALRRKTDFLAVGGKPTLGKITLDPEQLSKEHTLKGIGNAGRDLVEADIQNNKALITAMNDAGAAAAKGGYATGETMFNAGKSMLDGQKQKVTALYDRARSLNGGEIPLDHRAFADKAITTLDREMKGAFLPDEFRTMLNDISQGKIPLNISTAEQLRTMLATASRNAKDGNVKAAVGIMRDALEEAPASGQFGKDVVDAFGAARSAHRALREKVKTSPALQAIEDEMPVDKFFDKHVLNAPVQDLKTTIKALENSPEALQAMRSQMLQHLKAKALNGAADETATFSQSGYNRALGAIPEQKLKLLFSDDEIAKLRQVGRVASYNQASPAGNTINRSNTASQLFNLLMKTAEKVPFGKVAVVQPAQALISGNQVSKALNATVPVTTLSSPFITPAQQQRVVNFLAPAAVSAFGPSFSR